MTHHTDTTDPVTGETRSWYATWTTTEDNGTIAHRSRIILAANKAQAITTIVRMSRGLGIMITSLLDVTGDNE
jgi:hypothetical protein